MLARFTHAATVMAALLGFAAFSATAQNQDTATDGTIVQQVESAKTTADHEAVAKRFEADAARYDKQAERHEQLAKHYGYGHGAGPKTNTASLAQHCKRLAKNLRASAQDAREMAQLHRDLGKALAH